MADNYEYLQSAIPNAEPMARTIKLDWSGLNMTNKLESGELSDCNNVSSNEAPYLSPCPVPNVIDVGLGYNIVYPISFYSLKNNLYVLWMKNSEAWVGDEPRSTNVAYYITKFVKPWKFAPGTANQYTTTALAQFHVDAEHFKDGVNETYDLESALNELYSVQKNTGNSITSFISYYINDSNGTIEITNEPSHMLIVSALNTGEFVIYEDGSGADKFKTCSMFSVDSTTLKGSAIEPEVGSIYFPYLTVNQSRLFGAKDAIVGASGYMNYGDWETDLSYMTPSKDGYGANHAWISSLQSSDHSYSGEVTGIVAFGSRVVVFKADAMYEIANTKNPFRIVDVFNTGCIDGRSAKVVGGNLFFASEDGIYAYTGGKPECISRKLDIKRITSAVSGTDGKKYYLSCRYINKKDTDTSVLFVYDTEYGVWTKQDYKGDIIGMTYVDGHLYGIVNNPTSTAPGNADIVELNTENYEGQKWFAETDIMMNDTAGNYTIAPKRINKIAMLAEMNPGSTLEISVIGADEDYEDDDVVKKSYVNESDEVKTVPIRLNIKKKADYGLRVRVSGEGFSKVYSMEITYTDGGTLNVTDREGVYKP